MSLPKSRIIQEINRPTKSEILHLDGRRKRIQPKETVSDQILDKLKSAYTNEDLIFLEDIHMKGIEYSILKARIKDMANDGVIYRVASGIYALSLLEVSPERLIREKYLCRNGKTIGVYYRESIAYEYGLINEKPDIVSIQTNKESGLKGRLVNAFGQTIRLMGCRFKINDMTKEIAEALNILSCSLMKICSGEISKAEAIKHIHGHALTYDMFLPYISTQNKTLQRWVKEIFNIEPK